MPHDGYMLTAVDPVGMGGCFFAERTGFSPDFRNRLEEVDALGTEPHPFSRLLRGPTRVGVLSPGRHTHPDSVRALGMTAEGFGSEMRIALVGAGHPLGALVLVRRQDVRPFTAADTARAEALSGALAAAVREFLAHQALRPQRIALPPGVAIIGPDDTVRSVTPSLWDWLRLLRPVVPNGRGPVEGAEHLTDITRHIVLLARRTREPAMSRVPTPDGWVVLHGQPLNEAKAAASVVITLQQATTATLLPALSIWCGITPRERDVMDLLLEGLPTKRVATRLDVSVHTVNDHLKAIYRKLGASGRDELLANL
ncbi:LuxR C-terminal-related transcriptional regulator [Streptomyces buecherae]|uniref:LuxR C-terminal-related transcriptional regulator n=1 Tax=Streptomyces buecherae TaxID=2763006 RepID=UPI00364C722A